LAPSHGFLAALRQGVPYVATERGEGLEIAFVGGLHVAGDPVLRWSQLALGQTFSQRFKRDIFESVPLKKLGRLGVYFS
jgi:hypothetical protein